MDFSILVFAMAALGFFAAQVFPKDTAPGAYKPWTEAEFDYVVKRFIK